jgi:hypothetical protein
MELSGQFHAPDALRAEKQSPVSIVQESGWDHNLSGHYGEANLLPPPLIKLRPLCLSSPWPNRGGKGENIASVENRNPLFRAVAFLTQPSRLFRANQQVTTAWRRVLLEKPTVTQPLKKFTALSGTQRFITVFTRARHWSLS